MMKKILFLFGIALLSSFAMAIFSPQGNIYMRGSSLYNASYVNASDFYQGQYRVLDTSSQSGLSVNSTQWWITTVGALDNILSHDFSKSGSDLILNWNSINSTIDARSINSNCSVDQSCNTVLYESDLPLINNTRPYCGNVTGSNFDLCVNPDTDTTYSENSPYLTLVATVFGFNESYLNTTIQKKVIAGNTGKQGDGVYLYNDSSTMYFNESKMNNTIDLRAPAFDTNASTACLAGRVLGGAADGCIQYANWNTAYSWGNHAAQGYMKELANDTSPQLSGNLDANGHNVSVDQGDRFCLNSACSSYIYNNGTHTIIR